MSARKRLPARVVRAIARKQAAQALELAFDLVRCGGSRPPRAPSPAMVARAEGVLRAAGIEKPPQGWGAAAKALQQQSREV